MDCERSKKNKKITLFATDKAIDLRCKLTTQKARRHVYN